MKLEPREREAANINIFQLKKLRSSTWVILVSITKVWCTCAGFCVFLSVLQRLKTHMHSQRTHSPQILFVHSHFFVLYSLLHGQKMNYWIEVQRSWYTFFPYYFSLYWDNNSFIYGPCSCMCIYSCMWDPHDIKTILDTTGLRPNIWRPTSSYLFHAIIFPSLQQGTCVCLCKLKPRMQPSESNRLAPNNDKT